MQKVYTTECTSHHGIDGIPDTLDLHLCATASVGKDVTLAELNQSQLDVIAVGEEICFRVSCRSKHDSRSKSPQ